MNTHAPTHNGRLLPLLLILVIGTAIVFFVLPNTKVRPPIPKEWTKKREKPKPGTGNPRPVVPPNKWDDGKCREQVEEFRQELVVYVATTYATAEDAHFAERYIEEEARFLCEYCAEEMNVVFPGLCGKLTRGESIDWKSYV